MRAVAFLVAIATLACGEGAGTSTPGSPTLTPGTRALSGTVRDSQSNTGLSGVSVLILDGPAANRSTMTDAGGNYSLTGLPPAGFSIRFSRTGYNSVDRGVNLAQDGRLDIALVPISMPPGS